VRLQCLVLLSALAAACGGGDAGLGPPPPPGFNATGDWHFTDDVSASSLQIRCRSDGIFSIAVTGNTINGSGYGEGTCTTPAGTFTDSSTILFTGTLNGQDISFDDDECSYTGTLYDAGGGQIKASGPETCNVDDGAGHIYTLKGTWEATYVGDVTPPVASGTRAGPFGDTAVVVSDTLTIVVHATDNKRLAWVGYALGSPVVVQDSTAVTGRTADATLKTPIPLLASGQMAVKVFARDSAGYRRESTLEPISIVPGTRRSMYVLTLPAPVSDVAVNFKYGVVYLTYYGRPEIGVIDLARKVFAPSITTTFQPRKLDVSAGGDSLIVSVDGQPALAMLRVTTQPPATTIVRVDSNYLAGGWEAADNVRAMGNGKVLVTLKPRDGQNSSSPRIVDYDLATGLSRQRIMSDEVQWLARSWDRTMLATATGSSTPVAAQLYTAATDTFTDRQFISIPVWLYGASADSLGTRYLFANALFDGALNALRSFTDAEFQQGGGTVLSPDGATAYLGTWGGFLVVRTSDGGVLERSRLPFWPSQLAITADGGTLIAVGGSTMYFDPPNNQIAIIKLHGDD
jgi:hypothetical protein